MAPGVEAFAGSVPHDADPTEHAAAMIGQGLVLVSPLAMARAAASIAAGRRVDPRIVADPAPAGSDYAAGPSSLSQGEADALARMMRRAVTGGTATDLAGLGESVGAKTGTAEHGGEGQDTHAWMIAIDPELDLAAAVLVEGGGTGSGAAAPIITEFLSQLADQGSPGGEQTP
jgi:cell division protein FtsI/penicillin-binding protein 2